METKATPTEFVKILHISDTHGLHRDIEANIGPMPEADILLHTGDFTNSATDEEIADFDAWLASLKPRYNHILVIPGNHDFREAIRLANEGKLDPTKVLSSEFMQSRLPSVKVLYHETVNIDGLTIYGTPWEPWHLSECPENGLSHKKDRSFMFEAKEDKQHCHRYHELPAHTHIYMTHGPSGFIFDCLGGRDYWGSSEVMRAALNT